MFAKRTIHLLFIGVTCIIGFSQKASSAEYYSSGTGVSIDNTDYNAWEEDYNVQALLGAAKFEGLKFDVDGATEKIDLSLFPQLGGAWGTTPIGNYFQYGLECSFLFGFMADDISLWSSSGGGTWVRISASMWMFDLAGGGYMSLYLNKSRSLRVYLAGGPLMTYFDYRTRDDDDASIPEDCDQNESAFGIGVYARTGVEFRVYDAGMLGMGIRGTWNTVNLSEVGGNSDLTGVAAFVSFTAGF